METCFFLPPKKRRQKSIHDFRSSKCLKMTPVYGPTKTAAFQSIFGLCFLETCFFFPQKKRQKSIHDFRSSKCLKMTPVYGYLYIYTYIYMGLKNCTVSGSNRQLAEKRQETSKKARIESLCPTPTSLEEKGKLLRKAREYLVRKTARNPKGNKSEDQGRGSH